MSTEIVKVQPMPSLAERMNYAKALATADLLPPAYRNKPGNVLLAVEHGQALGIPPMTAIQGVHIIQGKPTLSADLMAALVRRAGHKLRITTGTEPPRATATLVRSDDPEFTYESTWDMDRARTASLLGKDTWKQHPLAMLKARAISEVIREGASEVLHGLIYTPEELGADVDGDGAVVAEAPANVDAETGEIHDADVVEESGQGDTEMITAKQTRLLAVLMKQADLTDRSAALKYAGDVIGREISSRNDLTKAEAGMVIDQLEADAAALASVVDAYPEPAGPPPFSGDEPAPETTP